MPASRRRQQGSQPRSFASQTPFQLAGTLERIRRRGKNAGRGAWSYRQGVAALHLTCCGLRGTVSSLLHPAEKPMRDLLISLKKLAPSAALGVLFGLLAFGQPAQAAYPWELNF